MAVGFLGLDELSLDLASSLIRAGFMVSGYHANSKAIAEGFIALGGSICDHPIEIGKGAMAIIAIVDNISQMEEKLYGTHGLLLGLSKECVIVLRPISLQDDIETLEKRLTEGGFYFVVDALVSRSCSSGLKVKTSVAVSGPAEAIEQAWPVIGEMSTKLHTFKGKVGASSKIRMVILLLEAIHLVAAAEAFFLCNRNRINPSVMYDILTNAAGSSWIFVDRVPQMIKTDFNGGRSLQSLLKDLGTIRDTAKSLIFPLPILAAAHEQLIYGSFCGFGQNADTGFIQAWEKASEACMDISSGTYAPEELGHQIAKRSRTVRRIGFIGLGAMGFGMATHLIKSKFDVSGYDVYEPTLARFIAAGGHGHSSPAEASKDVEVLILMVATEEQVESVLFGDSGAVSSIPDGASIILSSTVSPQFVKNIEKRLLGLHKELKIIDAPVSGGVKRAADGTLTIMAAGTEESLESAGSVLLTMSEKLYVVQGGAGAGSCVKMLNQLLAGVHIASAAEALAFGSRLGLNTQTLYEVIMDSEGSSWMFGNRVPHMLSNDYTPHSAINIFVKDLGIVLHEGRSVSIPLHVSAIAHQQFLSGSAAGLGRCDDASVVKIYERLTGISVEAKLPVLEKEDIMRSLPSEWPEDPISEMKNLKPEHIRKVLVVLDDDPTGTQTVHDVEVLTEWSIESLSVQFSKRPSCFFILTNSRSFSSDKAVLLIKDICTNIEQAAKTVNNIEYTIVLRSDSTLRGHFPEEADAVVSVLGEMDVWVICPFFLQGGRYTIEDIHYVADGDRLVPAGQTEFSKDASFGYHASNLRQWVEEKTRGRISASMVASISINLLRRGGPEAVCKRLCSLSKGSTCVVNAASERDVAVFVAGMIQAERKGKRFLCRTAATFVSARIGIERINPINPKDLGIFTDKHGSLIVVGSYVPKTTKQVEELISRCGESLKILEVSVEKLALRSLEERDEEISYAAEMADIYLKSQKDTLLLTSRELITGSSPSESLEINFKVSSALVEIVRRIQTRPRYILAKGGITSSDIATKALKARSAKVIGQALPGVPLWQLGPESKHPDVPYIVFPGNVGDSSALAELVRKWAPTRPSVKDILLSAGRGNYAIGAFNIYNLEGVEAVVEAAEEEKSPVILQIHPSALHNGGVPLFSCCIAAAKQAKVPVAVHFDHGTKRHELLEALDLGFNSIMVDGSDLPFKENVLFSKTITSLAHSKGILVEAELGRLSGTEDDLTVEEYESKLTDLSQAEEFIVKTNVDALAVCIGNIHGKYPESGPKLHLDLLKDLRAIASDKGVMLVLHGASGLPGELVKECIQLGVCKMNVNTEVRNAYINALKSPKKDLIQTMIAAKDAMKSVVVEKMRLFGSSGKAFSEKLKFEFTSAD